MSLDSMSVDLTVVLGRARLPLRQVLRLRRGATVALDGLEGEVVEILANGHPVARGRVSVRGLSIAVEVTDLIRKPNVVRQAGTTIGDLPPVLPQAPLAAAA